MADKNLIAFLHHLSECLIFRQVIPDFPPQNIMRRHQIRQRTVLPDQTVTVTGSRIKMKRSPAQLFFHGVQQNHAFLRADFTGTVIENGSLLIDIFLLRERDKIAAKCNIRVLHRNPDGQRLKRRTAGIEFLRVIPEHGQIGRVAPGLHAVRNCAHHAKLPSGRQRIHPGRIRILQRSLPSQTLNRTVSHPVPKNNHIFHFFLISARVPAPALPSRNIPASMRCGFSAEFPAAAPLLPQKPPHSAPP